ncbi:MAG: NADH-quinone oxidoreductase subunit C [Deltaproteobacteria bacterium]
MSFSAQAAVDAIGQAFPGAVSDASVFRGETTVFIDKGKVRTVCQYLKSELKFTLIADITAVDYLGVKSPRFEMVYLLHRFGADFDENIRLRLKAALSEEDAKIDSVTPVWSGADWLEREIFDMFGIEFAGHPDLRRILMPEDYEPFPLRKDFDVRDREASKRSFKRALEEG